MRQEEFKPFLAAQAGIEQSGFKIPRLTGHWAEGGVVWLTRVPGRNLRDYLRKGKQLEPEKGLPAEWAWKVFGRLLLPPKWTCPRSP